ncbi:hypothetical protein ACVFVO_20605 [Advenella kashmirensis]
MLTKFEVTLVLGAYIVAGQIWGGRTATIFFILAGIGYFVANELKTRNSVNKKLREQQACDRQIRDSVVRHKGVLLRKRRQGCFSLCSVCLNFAKLNATEPEPSWILGCAQNDG